VHSPMTAPSAEGTKTNAPASARSIIVAGSLALIIVSRRPVSRTSVSLLESSVLQMERADRASRPDPSLLDYRQSG
jgi:hypothetical protein